MSTDRLFLPVSRRQLLGRVSAGFGLAAFAGLASTAGRKAVAGPAVVRAPRAKRVIFLFMSGGVSHVDSFDPKPVLTARAGQPMPVPVDESHIAAAYANFCRVTGTPEELIVDFGLNKQVAGTDLEKKSLKEVVVAAWNGGKTLPYFNNAAQASVDWQSVDWQSVDWQSVDRQSVDW
jgi:hypothetical protein